MDTLGIISLIIWLITAILSAWYLARWVISKKEIKPRFKKRFLYSTCAFALTFVGAVIFLNIAASRKALELGFETSAAYQAAKRENVDDPDVWAEMVALNEAEAEELRLAAQEEVIKREAAEAERKAQQEAAEAERRAQQEAAEAEQRAAEQLRIAEEEANCRKDLNCWGERATVAAMLSCPQQIERMARYDYEWTDGFLDVKFSHYRWSDIENGIVTVLGDKIKFQNGFGAWSYMIYECDIHPETRNILDVRVSEGRL